MEDYIKEAQKLVHDCLYSKDIEWELNLQDNSITFKNSTVFAALLMNNIRTILTEARKKWLEEETEKLDRVLLFHSDDREYTIGTTVIEEHIKQLRSELKTLRK